MDINHFKMASLHQPAGFYVRGTGCFTIRERLYNKYADFSEIFWCIEGSGYFVLNGKKYKLNPGYLFYYPPGTYHDFYPGKSFFKYRWLSIDGKLCGALFDALGFSPGLLLAGNCPEDRFNLLEQNLQKNIKQAMLKSLSLAFDILTYAVAPKENERPFLERVQLFIEENFADSSLNISRIANFFQINRVSLSRSFQKQFGISPIHFLNSVRLQNGISLLVESPSLSIKEISTRCGFNSVDYFIKKFQKHTGMSPLQFRKSMAKDSSL